MSKYNDLPNDISISFRIPKQLRDDFNKACKDNFVNSSALIRDFMERYIKDNAK